MLPAIIRLRDDAARYPHRRAVADLLAVGIADLDRERHPSLAATTREELAAAMRAADAAQAAGRDPPRNTGCKFVALTAASTRIWLLVEEPATSEPRNRAGSSQGPPDNVSGVW